MAPGPVGCRNTYMFVVVGNGPELGNMKRREQQNHNPPGHEGMKGPFRAGDVNF